MAVVRCAGKRIPLCQDPCPSCGSCSTPCGCQGSGGNTYNGANSSQYQAGGQGGAMPFIFAPMQAPAPIIINSAPAQAPQAAPCPQPIIVFAPSSTQGNAADPAANSKPTTEGQTMPSTSIGGIVPGAGASTPSTSNTPTGSTNSPGQGTGNAQNVPSVGGIVPGAGASTPSTSVVPVPDSPAPTNTQADTGQLVPSTTPSGTMPLPASTDKPKTLSADNGSNQPSNASAQPIIINIHNSQDKDSNNRSVYAPDIMDSYNKEGASNDQAGAIRVRHARLIPGRRVRVLRQTPVSEVTNDTTITDDNNSQKSYHYVGWS